MSQKTFFIIFFVVLLGIAGFFFAAFFISRVEEKPLGEVLRDVSPFGDIVGDVVTGILSPTKDSDTDGTTLSDTATKDGVLQKLYKISAEPVAGAAAFRREGTEYVRYVLLETGHIYEYGATTTKKARLSNTTAPAIQEVVWGDNGDSLVVRYLDDNNVVKTYLGNIFLPKKDAAPGEASGEFLGKFLEDTVHELAVSPLGDVYFYLSGPKDSLVGAVSDFQNKKKEAVPGFSFSDWLVVWPKKDTLVLTSKPSAQAEGFAYTYSPATGTFKRLLGGIFGLTVLPSPSIEKVLYARAAQGGVETFLVEVKTGATERVSLSTLPEKCVWEKKGALVVYCGVPIDIPEGEYPDEWYKGKTTFSDSLWRVDTENGALEQLARPETDVLEAIDVAHPFLSTAGDFLFFINKKDSSLWSLKVSM